MGTEASLIFHSPHHRHNRDRFLRFLWGSLTLVFTFRVRLLTPSSNSYGRSVREVESMTPSLPLSSSEFHISLARKNEVLHRRKLFVTSYLPATLWWYEHLTRSASLDEELEIGTFIQGEFLLVHSETFLIFYVFSFWNMFSPEDSQRQWLNIFQLQLILNMNIAGNSIQVWSAAQEHLAITKQLGFIFHI